MNRLFSCLFTRNFANLLTDPDVIMLEKLHIQNYAIIDDLSIRFSDGLNIITGETGAGKSILMGALNLILGQRADSSVMHEPGKKCMVEGTFSVKHTAQLELFFESNDLGLETEILVRREIAPNGKSRSFINDTPVNLSQVKELSVLLVDLHQQFDTLDIGTENFQREVLDAVADNAALLLKLKTSYTAYSDVSRELQMLKEQQENASKEADYNRFLLDELVELSFRENELEEIDAEYKLLANAGNIKQQLAAVYFELKESEQPLVQQLKSLYNKLHSLEQLYPGVEPMSKRLMSAVIEVQDIADELDSADQSLQLDAERMQQISDRLSAGYKLLKKHGVNDTAGLLSIQESLQQKLDSVLNISGRIETLDKEQQKLYAACLKIAGDISAARSKQIVPLSDKVNKLLAQVGMPNARLKISMEQSSLSVHGTDEISFLFDANKSNRFEPLGKVASGGELSRLMLSIKSLVAQKLSLPTLIFDEIDTGISGEAAKQVGIIMKTLSEAHQLIAITHQPQIAARASAHFFVYKENRNGKIVTGVKILQLEERVTAIAHMLGGEKPTAAALENAREMVGI